MHVYTKQTYSIILCKHSFQIIAFLHIYSPIWVILSCSVAPQATVVLEGYINLSWWTHKLFKRGKKKKA